MSFNPENMTAKEMKKYALEELGVEIASSIQNRADIIGKIEEVIAFREVALKKEEVRVKSQKPFAEEEKMKVKFIHSESPKRTLTFDYEGFDAALTDGRIYDLPISIVKHLNSRVQPIYEPCQEEGQVCRKVGERNRFACIPV